MRDLRRACRQTQLRRPRSNESVRIGSLLLSVPATKKMEIHGDYLLRHKALLMKVTLCSSDRCDGVVNVRSEGGYLASARKLVPWRAHAKSRDWPLPERSFRD